jgi:hypothetical protein
MIDPNYRVMISLTETSLKSQQMLRLYRAATVRIQPGGSFAGK